MIAGINDLFCPFDYPRKNAFSGIVVKIVSEIFNVVFAFDFGIERNDDQPAPDTVVRGRDSRQVVGIQNERVTRGKAERIFVFLLGKNVIGGAELFDRGVIEPCTLLHFCRNQKPFALGFCHFRLDIPSAANGQGVSGDVSAVKPQNLSNGVPKGGFSVAAAAVCDDECLQEYLADGGKTAYHLHIVNEFPVVAENKVQTVLPYLCAFSAGGDGGHLGNEVLRAVFSCAVRSEAQIVGCRRGTEKKRIAVQVARTDFQHRAGLAER